MVKFIGFDTETIIKNNVHEFFSFQAYSEDFPFKEIYSENRFDLMRLLNNNTKNCFFVVYNLSFDAPVISKMLMNTPYKLSIFLAGSRIIRMTIRRGSRKWVFVDLKNIYPSPNLATIGKTIGFKKLDKPEYLGKRSPQTEAEKAYFREYAIQDAKICYMASKLIYSEFNTFRSTCAGLAVRVFKRDFCFIKKFHKYGHELNEKFRLSYHGGRTECFIRGTNFENLTDYDVNSLYPYVMFTKEFPNVCDKMQYSNDIDLEKEGLTYCTISVDSYFPLTCTKIVTFDNIAKLCFPNGKITGLFTNAELRSLEESGEGKILGVKESYYWRNTFNPFKEYIKTYYSKKEQATIEKSPKRQLYKIMLNSLYGKFGEHGECNTALMYDGLILNKQPSNPKSSWYHSVPIASYITSYARLHLWEIIRNLEPQKVYYVDTDSIFTSHDLSSKIGDKLGQLKIEQKVGPYDACFIRSKFYTCGNTVTLKGFRIQDNASQLKLSIYEGNFTRYEHRILKALEAERIKKPVLFDYEFPKKFTIEADGKRIFDKKLNNKTLLFESSASKPLQV